MFARFTVYLSGFFFKSTIQQKVTIFPVLSQDSFERSHKAFFVWFIIAHIKLLSQLAQEQKRQNIRATEKIDMVRKLYVTKIIVY